MIPTLQIRRSHDRLIYNMGIAYLGKTVFILRRDPNVQGEHVICAWDIVLTLQDKWDFVSHSEVLDYLCHLNMVSPYTAGYATSSVTNEVNPVLA